MQLFDYVKDLSSGKAWIYDPDTSSNYSTFMVNRAFSFYPDTIFIAAEAACKPMLTDEMHYGFMFHSIPKKNRFTKWPKREDDEIIPCLQELYNYSRRRAEEAAGLLNEADRKEIFRLCNKGGKVEKTRTNK